MRQQRDGGAGIFFGRKERDSATPQVARCVDLDPDRCRETGRSRGPMFSARGTRT